MSQTVTDAMGAIDDRIRTARTSGERARKFARLRRAFLTPGEIKVATRIRGVDARTQVLPEPYRLVPFGDGDARICIFGSNGVLADRGTADAFMRDNPDCACVVWLFDNHHIYNENQALCDAFDAVVPAHFASLDYLYSRSAVVTSPVPCACVQWSPREVEDHFRENATIRRSNALYGGFRRYEPMPRNSFIEELIAKVPDCAVKLLDPAQQRSAGSYFEQPAREQIIDWMSHKASVVVAVKNDIPMRLFDALATGQIPLLPWDTIGLDTVIGPLQRAKLPVLTYAADDVDAVTRCRDLAVQLFDRDGAAGAERRHRFALDGHMAIHRIAAMMMALGMLAQAC